MATCHGQRTELIRPFKLLAALILFICFLSISGCTSPPPQPRYVWPIPPQTPRVEYLSTISRSEDLVAKNSPIKKALLGKQKPLFQTPFDVIVRKDGALLVSDTRSGIVWKLSTTGKASALPNNGTKLGAPLGIDYDSDGNIYVAEATRRRVVVLSPEGVVIRTIGDGVFEANPAFIAIDRQRNLLYASEPRRHHIHVFTCTGKHLGTRGNPGVQPGQLAAPQGVAVNSHGELIVADMLNARLSVFAPDGTFARLIPFNGWGPYTFDAPKGITVTDDGWIWATDQRAGALVGFNNLEKPTVVVTAGHMSSHPMAFAAPSGLTITDDGAIWVTDILLQRLSHWQVLTPEYLKTHPISPATLEQLRQKAQLINQESKEEHTLQ
ncbi:MAG: hypothetical protein D6694_06820 [Gammaproteobacteria bacterium]|nr:MAG: hypothetical protein D6694_06820 [Gammaproteobacteria bacterium]